MKYSRTRPVNIFKNAELIFLSQQAMVSSKNVFNICPLILQIFTFLDVISCLSKKLEAITEAITKALIIRVQRNQGIELRPNQFVIN